MSLSLSQTDQSKCIILQPKSISGGKSVVLKWCGEGGEEVSGVINAIVAHPLRVYLRREEGRKRGREGGRKRRREERRREEEMKRGREEER